MESRQARKSTFIRIVFSRSGEVGPSLNRCIALKSFPQGVSGIRGKEQTRTGSRNRRSWEKLLWNRGLTLAGDGHGVGDTRTGVVTRVGSQGQTNFDHEAALRTVGGADGAAVQCNRSFGDGEAEADASGLAAAGIVDAVERAKQLVKRFFRYAGT